MRKGRILCSNGSAKSTTSISGNSRRRGPQSLISGPHLNLVRDGVANWVIHGIILDGLIRLQRTESRC